MTTFQDVIDHIVDYVGGTPGSGDALARDAKRASLEAYRDLVNAHRWSYLYTQGRVICVPPFLDGTIAYQHTGGAYERMVTLSGGVWPAWAMGGYIRNGQVGYKVSQRISATVVTLDEQVNPGADLASGLIYVLYRDTYVLPVDFIAQDQSLYEANFGGMEYVHPREWLFESRYVFSEGQPRQFTITGDTLYPGRLTMKITPFPTDTKSIDFLYSRRPRPLVIQAVSTGAVTLTSGSAVVTGTGTAFTPAMVGSILRVSATAGKLPTSLVDDNPADFETRITGFVSATSVVVATFPINSYTLAKYTVGDPVDIEEGAMLNAYFRRCEACVAQNRTLKDKPSAQKQYMVALNEARAADSRSFAGRAAGARSTYRQRLRDMPSGPDDIN